MTNKLSKSDNVIGIVYKITDLDTGKFYIGETTQVDKFYKEKYNGSGTGEWLKYFLKYKDLHSFKREVLKDDFNSLEELYEYELNQIKKYCIKLENNNYKVDKSTGCMNVKTTKQWEDAICPECGGVCFHHYKTCSEYNPSICEECGGKNGHHKKSCSDFKDLKICPECGNKGSRHKSTCSKRNVTICSECDSPTFSHKKSCSKFLKRNSCNECKGKDGKHKKDCSKYTVTACSECGGAKGHKKFCSYYKVKSCLECGGVKGHFDYCSKSKGKCPECGYSLRSHKHSKTCSKYKRKDNIK